MIKGNKKKWSVCEELSGTFDQPKLLLVAVGYNGLFHPHLSEDESRRASQPIKYNFRLSNYLDTL